MKKIGSAVDVSTKICVDWIRASRKGRAKRTPADHGKTHFYTAKALLALDCWEGNAKCAFAVGGRINNLLGTMIRDPGTSVRVGRDGLVRSVFGRWKLWAGRISAKNTTAVSRGAFARRIRTTHRDTLATVNKVKTKQNLRRTWKEEKNVLFLLNSSF